MDIKYTSHAVERMIQRKITPSEVEQTILKPDGKILQSLDKWIFYKKFRNRRDNLVASVAVEKKGNNWEVITVMINFEVYS